ncbi:signal transduction histidine kinase [Paenarthrobacter nicotinovorans]|uniref:histidine kinase n=1 Tax=Paenarthrobacter nicotinovorans TaxID=29320 RepID=A0ABT9TQ55_PAENI|nr:ATP-binding protein [Paenarthrobacter nicotinovorans]MDQ0103364.1 signal transduction histidine kinase [Paenarthrobacter nicotinovorans]
MAEPTGKLRPRARLVHTLGSDLISNERIALIELVKNSYDADATHVIIRFSGDIANGGGSVEVWDNGHGMSLDVVQNVWTDIATPFRGENQYSESKNRRVLGEKGIGRLAASRIGARTQIITRRANSAEVTVDLDWDQFEHDIYLDQVVFRIESRQPETFTADGQGADVLSADFTGHGTAVYMQKLRRPWSASDLRELRLALSRLVEPLPAGSLEEEIVQDFTITLVLPPDFRDLAGPISPSDALAHPHYSISGLVASDGKAELVYHELLSGRKEEVRLVITIPSDDGVGRRAPTCGPIKVDIRAWDLDKEAFEAAKGEVNLSPTNLRNYRSQIKEHSGVAIFRDRFRVQPFGDATFDWLNLDARRVNNPTLRLSNNQVSGFVFITANDNSELKDRSHREGLIDTSAYDDLRLVILAVIQELESRRRSFRKVRDTRSDSKGDDGHGGLFHEFSLSSLRALSLSRSHDLELVQAVKETQASVESGIENVKRTLSRFSRLATLGSVVDIVLHEGRSAVGKIKSGSRHLEKAIELDADEIISTSARSNVKRFTVGAEILSNLFRRIEPLSGRRRGRPSKVDLSVIIDNACDLLDPEFQRLSITVEKRLSPLMVTVDQGEIMQILINLLENACHWLTHTDKDSRIVLVETLQNEEGHVMINVSDSGPGVPENIRDEIFDPYFSTKPNGTGLGLAIVGSTVQDFYDGSLELVTSDELPGASFKITLRTRVGG